MLPEPVVEPAARLLPREPCLVCLTPVPVQPSALDGPTAKLPPICPACWEQLRNQHQPIAGYMILKKLGHGGMGVVQLAIRTVDNSLVALKTIIPSVAGSQTKVERFLREADILQTLDHPNIVSFRDMGSSNGQLYFAMDYVPGTDAAHLLRQNGGPLPIPRAVNLVCQLLDALDYAHSKGFVHRDIKPANLMVTRADGRELVKLADFGLARVYQASELSGLTMMGDMGGTLAFMAPEQITHFREAKPAADLYASAATLYNLITDKFVHDLPKPAEQRLLMILTDEAVRIQSRRRDIPDALSDIIHRSLAKDPELRFADAKSMRMALLPFSR
jgi:serine/threonine-protein kinase